MEVTWRYLAGYLAAASLVVAVFYAVPSGIFESFTAASSAWALVIFGHQANWVTSGGVTKIVLVGQRVVDATVIRECTALNVLGIIAGLIMPLRAQVRKKLAAFIISGISLFALNVPRIALTLYLTAYDTFPFSLLPERSLETYHYPISFAFGVAGVALLVLALSRWVIPELAETLLGSTDLLLGGIKEGRKRVGL